MSANNNSSETNHRLVSLPPPDVAYVNPKDDKPYPANIIISSRYTLLNFFPKNLLEQYRRLSNVYFLVIGLIAVIGEYTSAFQTSIQPEGILVPMAIVIVISMIKDGVEDVKRHNADNAVNARLARIARFPTGEVVTVPWRDLKVGDVLVLLMDDEIPADTLVLCAGGIQGNVCYVETAAIDGETNLKLKTPCLPKNQLLQWDSSAQRLNGLEKLHLEVTAEPPNGSIHRFNGLGKLGQGDSEDMIFSDKQLLLRGSVLRATEWSIGMVMYTGKDTKLSLNSKKTPSKMSAVDQVVNRTLVLAIFAMIILCFVSMAFSSVFVSSNGNANYLCLSQNSQPACANGTTNSYLTFFTFLTLYNNFVCISMVVSLELIYLSQGYFLTCDLNLYDPESDTPAECHSSGQCADLGQIQYVLSDKTGTLTKNHMVVKQFSVDDKVFGEPLHLPPQIVDDEDDHQHKTTTSSSISTLDIEPWSSFSSPSSSSSSNRLDFLRVLVYCHTAMLMPDRQGQVSVNNSTSLKACLQAESADEVALILAVAQHCEVLLVNRSDRAASVRGLSVFHGKKGLSLGQGHEEEDESVEVLAVNEFDSDRKMMSVLVRTSSGRLMLLCKGADSSVLARCDASLNPFTQQCQIHIDTFAQTGLRTLVAACRDVSDSEAEVWMQEYRIARSSLRDRQTLLSTAATKLEIGLRLCGAVGIEDELQDGVPETIELLRSAGLNVWIITGDKVETAVAIGQKCNLISASRNRLERIVNLSGEALVGRVAELKQLVDKKKEQVNDSVHRRSSLFSKELALVVDGMSLEGIWASEEVKNDFVHCIQSLSTVVACRVSPLQKAALVKMIKAAPSRPITLAIGDGANDVGMIHEAKVGVGISGKEGRHAANSSDFAISQFRFLTILLFDHGRFNYMRCSKLILYSFFKNLFLVSLLFYYCSYSGYSGTIPLDTLVFSGYNFYLGLPVLCLGSFDFDIPRKDILRHPDLAYATGRLGEMLNMTNMLKWCSFAFFQGLLLFILAFRFIGGPIYATSQSNATFNFDIYGTGLNNTSNGSGYGVFTEGFLMFTVAVIAMMYKIIAMCFTPNIIFWVFWWISLIGYILFCFIFGSSTTLDWYHTVAFSFSQPVFWLAILLIPFVLCLSDYFFESGWSYLFPDSRDKLIELLRHEDLSITMSQSTSSPSEPAVAMVSQKNLLHATDNEREDGRSPL